MGLFNFLKGKNKTNKLGENQVNTDIVNENGLNEIYYTNGSGQIKEKFIKKNGLINGVFERWYENGNIKGRMRYQKGNQVGKAFTYDDDGDLIRESEIKDINYINEIKEFYKNGNLRIRIIISDDNKKADEYLLYTPEGIIKTRLYLIRKNINESILEVGINPTLKYTSWNVEVEQNDSSNTEKLLPDLTNPIWTSYDSKGNKKQEIDFSTTLPECWDDKDTLQYTDGGLGVFELREYNENSTLISRANKIILQVNLDLFMHTIEAIFNRRKNEGEGISLINSNLDLAKDVSSVESFDNILLFEDFSSLHYLSLIIKKDVLAKYQKVKEQRNWIKGFDNLYKLLKPEDRMQNVAYYVEDGEQEIPYHVNLPQKLSYMKSHVIISTFNEMDCMQLIHHIMLLNGGVRSFAKYDSDDAEFDCIYRNEIIRINKFAPQISKYEIKQGFPKVDIYNGGLVIDLLPPKNLSGGDVTTPRGIHIESKEINRVLLGLNKPVYCKLEGGCGDGRFTVLSDDESGIILSHNEEFQINDFKNIIRCFSSDNIILKMGDKEIKLLLDSSNLLSKDAETGMVVNFKGGIKEEDTALCFTINDKLMISMYKDHARYSIRIDKLTDSEWKDLIINKSDEFKFHVAEEASKNLSSEKFENLKDVNLKINELYQDFNQKMSEIDDGTGTAVTFWYDIVKNMASQFPLNNDVSFELQIKEFVYGNYDEYKNREDLIGASEEHIEYFARMRVFSFGKIYSELILLEHKILQLLKKHKVKKHKVTKQLINEIARAKARTYGTIKYALSVNISKNKILEWFPEFIDDQELIKGVNPLDSLSEKYNLNLPSSTPQYELTDKENIPEWYSGPIDDEGCFIEDKETGKAIQLTGLEATIYNLTNMNKKFIEGMEDDINSGKANNIIIESTFYQNMIEQLDQGKLWLKENNLGAYRVLFGLK